ncbi:MAG: ATP-binding cassette domain-containing protein, partial [Candidatus Bathyarchaeia archaeon]
EREERLKEILDIFPIVKSSLDRRAGTLSGGERQMLAIAMALFRKPKLMLFDEPTAHLAPKIANEILEKIIELKESLGITIVLVEQNAKRALEISDYALLMVSGRVKFNDKASKLLEEPEIGKLYIGL